MIGGAILAGPIAGTLTNIGAFMAIGTIAGIISALYFGKIHPKLNKINVKDTYGALYIAIVSFLGTVFVAPLVLIGMVRNEVFSSLLVLALPAPGTTPAPTLAQLGYLTNSDIGGWSLTYVAISVGVALIAGFSTGAFMTCMEKKVNREFDDENIFVPLPGLYDAEYPASRSRVRTGIDDYVSNSASQLRPNQGI
jgi:hypothetical protein